MNQPNQTIYHAKGDPQFQKPYIDIDEMRYQILGEKERM